MREEAMSFQPEFLIRIAKATGPPGKESRMMSITIERPYAHLKEELLEAFAGQTDVKVVVDRRYGERRTAVQPVQMERRQADRRRPKENLVDVVIST